MFTFTVPETEAFPYWTIPLAILFIASVINILIIIAIRRCLPNNWNSAIQSLTAVFPCYIKLFGRDETTGPGIEEDEEAGMIREEDRHPIQATLDGTSSDPTTQPKYGFTTHTPHEEAELIKGLDYC